MRCANFHIVAGLLALSTAACADNQEAILIEHVPFWPGDEVDGVVDAVCAVDPATDIVRLRGSYDVSFGTPYWMPAVVVNNLLGTAAGSSPTGIDDSEISLVDAVVKLDMPQAPDIITDIRAQNKALVSFKYTLQSVSIEASEKQGILVEIVPEATAEALATAVQAGFEPGTVLELTAEVKVRANRTASGSQLAQLESRPFVYPIDMGFGTLRSCELCVDDVCPAATTDWQGGVCGNAQDFSLFPSACLVPDGGP